MQAIVYMDAVHGLSTIDNTGSVEGEGYHRPIDDLKLKADLRKIGEMDIQGVDGYAEARPIAKAYFAEPEKKLEPPHWPVETEPVYKVGDLVEVVSVSVSASESLIGSIMKYRGLSDEGNETVVTDDGREGYLSAEDLRPLQGTYAEKQAKAVEFYGWKVGSKVKVVRKFKENEDGYTRDGWDSSQGKKELQGEITVVGTIFDDLIQLKIPNTHIRANCPYFALEPAE